MSEHTTYAGFAHHLGHERPDHLAANLYWSSSNTPGRASSVSLAIETDFSPSNRRSDDRNDGYIGAMADDSDEQSIRARQTIRIVLWVAIAAVVVALALANTQDVTVDWLFADFDTSVWVVIVASAAVGVVLGYLARWRRD